MLDTIYIVVGVVLLYIGGESLIRGAYRAAIRAGVTALTAGLIIVSFATSMPEAAASVAAQIKGNLGDLALGNVIGSNIANVGLILGITALICPVKIAPVMGSREMPIMLLALVVLMLLMLDGYLTRGNGIVLLCLLALYLVAQVWIGKIEHQPHLKGETREKGTMWLYLWDFWLIVGGLAALAIGGYSMVQGGVGIATRLGLSERVVGLTIVAVGSSLPELTTTIIASLRKQSDIALGNVIGSNVFNALFIVGIASLIRPIRFTHDLMIIDAPVMLFLSLILWAITILAKRVGRLSGAALVILYVAYIVFGVFWR